MRSFLYPAFALSLTLGFNACDFLSGPAAPHASADSADSPSSPSAAAAAHDEAGLAPLGSALFADPSEASPGLAKLTGDTILWRSDFEDQTPSCWGARNSSGYATAACGEFGGIGSWGAKLDEYGTRRSGSKSLAVTYVKNEDVAGATLTLSANVVDVRAYYYFGTGYDFGQGVKIARVQSFNESTQLNDIDIVMTVRSRGGIDQCGTTDMSDMGLFFNGRPVGFDWGNLTSARTFQRNRWYAIEYQVFLNTPGVKDGWVKIWVDGVEAASKTGLNIRGNGGWNVKLNRIRLGGWYSNSANGNICPNPSQPSTMYVDDVAVGTQYIGPN
ncbi:MAG TPA: hypothetical protein VJ385_08010 [Fibrobacteria bacterium]|nr:hypothetical protein [Fibrobacteria bacterium]